MQLLNQALDGKPDLNIADETLKRLITQATDDAPLRESSREKWQDRTVPLLTEYFSLLDREHAAQVLDHIMSADLALMTGAENGEDEQNVSNNPEGRKSAKGGGTAGAEGREIRAMTMVNPGDESGDSNDDLDEDEAELHQTADLYHTANFSFNTGMNNNADVGNSTGVNDDADIKDSAGVNNDAEINDDKQAGISQYKRVDTAKRCEINKGMGKINKGLAAKSRWAHLKTAKTVIGLTTAMENKMKAPEVWESVKVLSNQFDTPELRQQYLKVYSVLFRYCSCYLGFFVYPPPSPPSPVVGTVIR
jgi:hypothetical protein